MDKQRHVCQGGRKSNRQCKGKIVKQLVSHLVILIVSYNKNGSWVQAGAVYPVARTISRPVCLCLSRYTHVTWKPGIVSSPLLNYCVPFMSDSCGSENDDHIYASAGRPPVAATATLLACTHRHF
jgi:hypothetical protein